MQRADSLEKTLMLGKIEGRRRRGWQRMRWLDDITDSMDMDGFGWTPGVGDGQGGLGCCGSWGCKESDMTEQLNWTEPLEHMSHWVRDARGCPRLGVLTSLHASGLGHQGPSPGPTMGPPVSLLHFPGDQGCLGIFSYAYYSSWIVCSNLCPVYIRLFVFFNWFVGFIDITWLFVRCMCFRNIFFLSAACCLTLLIVSFGECNVQFTRYLFYGQVFLCLF